MWNICLPHPSDVYLFQKCESLGFPLNMFWLFLCLPHSSVSPSFFYNFFTKFLRWNGFMCFTLNDGRLLSAKLILILFACIVMYGCVFEYVCWYESASLFPARRNNKNRFFYAFSFKHSVIYYFTLLINAWPSF